MTREIYTSTVALNRADNVFDFILDLQTSGIRDLVGNNTQALVDFEVLFCRVDLQKLFCKQSAQSIKSILKNAGFPKCSKHSDSSNIMNLYINTAADPKKKA